MADTGRDTRFYHRPYSRHSLRPCCPDCGSARCHYSNVVKMRQYIKASCYTQPAPTLERCHETYWFVDKPLRA